MLEYLRKTCIFCKNLLTELEQPVRLLFCLVVPVTSLVDVLEEREAAPVQCPGDARYTAGFGIPMAMDNPSDKER